MTDDDGDITVKAGARVMVFPAREFWFEFDRSGGPGGQHVNKTATRASLCFHPESSGVLTPEDKARAARVLSSRIGRDGVLRVTAESERSQSANRREARERFAELLSRALTPPRPRHATRPTRASRERRLVAKHHIAERKNNRKRQIDN